MTDGKNNSNDYKIIINKTYEISSALESISNSALMYYTSTLANTLENLSNAIPSESMKGIIDVSEAATASVVGLSNAFIIDSGFIENTQILDKTMEDISSSLVSKSLRRTSELAAALPNIVSINSVAAQSVQNIANTVQKMNVSIPNFSEMVSAIDWDTIDFTDNDIEEAEKIITSKSINVVVSEEIKKDTTIPQLPNSIMYILLLFVFMLSNFSLLDFSSISIENMNISVEINTNENIPSIDSNVKSNVNSEKDSKQIPKKHITNRIHKKIKKELPKIFLGSLGIITKRIYVYAKKRLNSKRIGKLNSFVVVKIIKQDRNWTYVLYQDSDGNIITEGWTLTRYIQKIQ